MPAINAAHPVDKIPAMPQLFALGLQHVLVMYAGAIAVPLIIGSSLNMPKDQIAHLISADLFASGIVTIIQSKGIWRFGARLPVMMGVTFASVPPMLLIGADPNLGLRGIYGSVIGAGVIILLLAPLMSKLIKFFPSVVTGTVITMTGLSLMTIGINWSAGGRPTVSETINGVTQQVANPAYGSLDVLGIAAVVLLIILAITKFARGFASNIAVLIGIAGGLAIAISLGRVELVGLAEAKWFDVVRPFHYGMPIFNSGAIFSMTVVMLIVMAETAGMLLAVGVMVERPVNESAMADGLRVDGIGSIIGGVFNTFPYVSYSNNVGLVGVTGVKSRWVCVMGGCILIVFGLVPKLSVIAASIPIYVLGGAGVVMFGMVCATGIKILSEVNLSERKNLYIIGVSMVMGMIPVLSPTFFAHMPSFMQPITHSGIVLSALTAFGLNLWFFHFRPQFSGVIERATHRDRKEIFK